MYLCCHCGSTVLIANAFPHYDNHFIYMCDECFNYIDNKLIPLSFDCHKINSLKKKKN